MWPVSAESRPLQLCRSCCAASAARRGAKNGHSGRKRWFWCVESASVAAPHILICYTKLTFAPLPRNAGFVAYTCTFGRAACENRLRAPAGRLQGLQPAAAAKWRPQLEIRVWRRRARRKSVREPGTSSAHPPKVLAAVARPLGPQKAAKTAPGDQNRSDLPVSRPLAA